MLRFLLTLLLSFGLITTAFADTVRTLINNTDWVEVQEGTAGVITNNSPQDIVVRHTAIKPDASITSGHEIHPSEDLQYTIQVGEKIFARSRRMAKAYVAVTENAFVPGFDSRISSLALASFETSARGNTAFGVFIQDQTTQAIDVFFTNKEADVTTTTVASQGFHSVDLEPGHTANIGDVIESRTAENFVQAEIINVVGDTITVSTPWSRTFPIGTTVGLGSPLLSVVGSLASPVIFSIDPSSLQEIDMTRLILNFIDNAAMDFTTFGSLAQLSNGITLRYLQGDGTFINFFNFRSNGELIERSFDHVFQSKVGGGSFGFVARSTWSGQDKRGVTIRLDGALAEELQLVVQDDLTALDLLRVVGQGHIVQ
jgi:hypothetical protein